ncbi:MAG: ParB/RepB/Spo0J family partition protein [Phormidesmis sp.]
MARPELHDTDLGGVDALFANIGEATQIAQLIERSKIKLPDHQPRRSFDEFSLNALAKSIEKNGILQPLVVRPLSDGFYELVAGERRLRASKIVGLADVPCISRDLSSDEAYEIALVENLQREDLNPIDETEGILELLERLLGKNKNELIATFHQLRNKNRGGENNVILSEDWEKICQVFERISKITPESFSSNRLPLLKLPQDVLDAVRSGQLEYTKAKAIGGISETEARQVLLTDSIENSLSLTEIKKRVKAVKDEGEKKPKATVSKVLNRMESLYKKAKKPELWNKPDKREKLEKILADLEMLLNESHK